ncbi:hypothetical protein, partial [Sphingomonas sp. 66-10]|uniref:hypothetical protein n=1 Tax=Sphingomonas sp. 66-10 TaxID=1895848 RepID=UPI00257EF0F6
DRDTVFMRHADRVGAFVRSREAFIPKTGWGGPGAPHTPYKNSPLLHQSSSLLAYICFEPDLTVGSS